MLLKDKKPSVEESRRNFRSNGGVILQKTKIPKLQSGNQDGLLTFSTTAKLLSVST